MDPVAILRAMRIAPAIPEMIVSVAMAVMRVGVYMHSQPVTVIVGVSRLKNIMLGGRRAIFAHDLGVTAPANATHPAGLPVNAAVADHGGTNPTRSII
jgi:hypothetical protein